MSSQWNSKSRLKPKHRDHFSEEIRFSRWLEVMESEQRHKERQENEKHRDTKRDTKADGE